MNKLANIRNAARAIVSNLPAATIEDIGHVCANYGIPLEEMSEHEFKEFFKTIYSYSPKRD